MKIRVNYYSKDMYYLEISKMLFALGHDVIFSPTGPVFSDDFHEYAVSNFGDRVDLVVDFLDRKYRGSDHTGHRSIAFLFDDIDVRESYDLVVSPYRSLGVNTIELFGDGGDCPSGSGVGIDVRYMNDFFTEESILFCIECDRRVSFLIDRENLDSFKRSLSEFLKFVGVRQWNNYDIFCDKKKFMENIIFYIYAPKFNTSIYEAMWAYTSGKRMIVSDGFLHRDYFKRSNSNIVDFNSARGFGEMFIEKGYVKNENLSRDRFMADLRRIIGDK